MSTCLSQCVGLLAGRNERGQCCGLHDRVFVLLLNVKSCVVGWPLLLVHCWVWMTKATPAELPECEGSWELRTNRPFQDCTGALPFTFSVASVIFAWVYFCALVYYTTDLSWCLIGRLLGNGRLLPSAPGEAGTKAKIRTREKRRVYKSGIALPSYLRDYVIILEEHQCPNINVDY
ncbi:uncharacterized protein HD556DRAFT_1302623 [Suillus plorans]|uniref:Uncharacterized protein n=1 Tax=Suillus plorans TaxID=116603 RepID=A0A9P7J9L5_9AGAM|nr:uncharacterized protein HD556DRAFT_1302623 [Suillus plorans]KAG1810286.1 hypothetical protein HD556DRAFT_1302623 [Suillus plorans]